MVSDQGGLQAAKSLLHSEGSSEGLTALWELARLDITMEAVAIQQPWSQLFKRTVWSLGESSCLLPTGTHKSAI
jgi:hypothetical protein